MSADPTPTGTAAPKVFICYRREETAAYAGRLYDAAVARLGAANVFMDVDLAPGLDFVERITDAVGACRVLLVVMGPRWATVAHDGEDPRVADPEDYVRLEVETALRRSEVTVIPVLVAGAQMPDRDDLPQELQPLTRRNALELSDARWRYDVGRLLDALDTVLAEFAGVREPPASAPAPAERQADAQPAGMASQGARRLILEAILVAGGAALVAGWIAFALFATPKGSPSNLRLIALPIERRALVWAVAGAALVLWLTVRRGDGGLVGRAVQGLLVGAIAGAVGGAIAGLFAKQPTRSDPIVDVSVSGNLVGVASVAVTGVVIGALIGSRWLPASRRIGCAGGAIAGALVGLIFIPLSTNGTLANGLRFGFTAAAIAGLAVAFLLAVSARRRPASAAAPLRVPASDAARKA